MRKFLLLIGFMIFLSNSVAQGQSETFYCFSDQPTIEERLLLPTHSEELGRYLRMLIIYVTFRDDTLGSSVSDPYLNIWPSPDTAMGGTRPVNPYTDSGQLIDSSESLDSIPFMHRYSEYTYSNWFSEMSQGKLDVIGDEVFFRMPLFSYQYQNILFWRRKELNRWILNYVNDSLNIDFSRYDNWTYSNGQWSWGQDGSAEMIVIQFRALPGSYNNYYWGGFGNFGGSGTLGIDTTLTLGSTMVGNYNGITATRGVGRTTGLIIVTVHEICHYIFGNYFNHPGLDYGHTVIGLMTPGYGNSSHCMTPMERCMPGLNWCLPDTVTQQNVLTSYTLNDFISSGQCLKVEIPNTNPKEYFWLSNHQKVSMYDGISRGSNSCWTINKYQQDPYCGEGKGLYIFHESSGNCPNNVYGYNTGTMHYPFDLINSEGRFSWITERTVFDQVLGSKKLMGQLSGRRDSGVSEYNKYRLIDTDWSAQLITDNPCSDLPEDYYVTGDFHGDGLDAFNFGYDEIFSPYSNPSTRSCQNLSSNTGLTFHLMNIDTSTGSISVKIYYDDQSALSELPPSKPKNLKAFRETTDSSTGAFHPRLVWDPNIEPDFISIGQNPEHFPKYKIYRAESGSCHENPMFEYLTFVTTNTFTDQSALLYSIDPNGYGCNNYQPKTYYYKVSASDNTDKESLPSEKALISGFVDPCYQEPVGPDNFLRDFSGTTDITEYKLHKNFPNPFN